VEDGQPECPGGPDRRDDVLPQQILIHGPDRRELGRLVADHDECHTEICLTFASVQALKDGYDVMYVTDAVGGRSQAAHHTGIERLAHAGAVPTTALAVVTELFRDWAGPLAAPALDVIHWYFLEVPKHADAVGVAEAETLAATAAGTR